MVRELRTVLIGEMKMNREEHLQWCKNRALEYSSKGDLKNAIASMLSDLRKHEETENHAGIQLGAMLMFSGNLSTKWEVEEFINGFN